jgi:hypothetical protein
MTTPAPALLALPDFDYEEMTMDELTELRAAFIQLEKALETARACAIRSRKVIERRMGMPAVKEAPRTGTATIAGAVRTGHTSVTGQV